MAEGKPGGTATPRAPGGAAGRRPSSPHVFECKLCGKVFDSRQQHPACPECDAYDVEEMG